MAVGQETAGPRPMNQAQCVESQTWVAAVAGSIREEAQDGRAQGDAERPAPRQLGLDHSRHVFGRSHVGAKPEGAGGSVVAGHGGDHVAVEAKVGQGQSPTTLGEPVSRLEGLGGPRPHVSARGLERVIAQVASNHGSRPQAAEEGDADPPRRRGQGFRDRPRAAVFPRVVPALVQGQAGAERTRRRAAGPIRQHAEDGRTRIVDGDDESRGAQRAAVEGGYGPGLGPEAVAPQAARRSRSAFSRKPKSTSARTLSPTAHGSRVRRR